MRSGVGVVGGRRVRVRAVCGEGIEERNVRRWECRGK